jgi:hypothetical protein
MKTLRSNLILIAYFAIACFVLAGAAARPSPHHASGGLADISGIWTSKVASFHFAQEGYEVGGTVKYEDGREAWVLGEMRNEEWLRFIWGTDARVLAEASLMLSDDGKLLKGAYIDLESGKVTGLTLVRDVGSDVSTPQ